MMAEIDKKKQVIGLLGEMSLSMELHERGWQVHKAYIDEGIDFVITKYYCTSCKKFTEQLIDNKIYQNKTRKCVTNKCSRCKKETIKLLTRAIQVKTSEGKNGNYSFHPKIRYDMNGRIFYVWIAVIDKKNLHYYIFNTKDVKKFDDISIDTYQITDNQKTSLRINANGEVLNKGKKHSYSCFKKFHNNFACLDEILKFDNLK
jgi:hypothetical protein